MSNSHGIEVNTGHFGLEGLLQLLHCVTAEEGPRGRSVLLLTSMPRELLTNSPHFEFNDMAMSLYVYNVMWNYVHNHGAMMLLV